MKNQRKKFVKVITAIMFVTALSLSPNIYAGNGKKVGKGYGHSSHGNGNGYGHSSHGNGNGYGHRHNNSCDHGSGDSIPLDGGLSILLVGAAAFGIKKLRDNKNVAI